MSGSTLQHQEQHQQLLTASAAGNVQHCAALLERGLDPNFRNPLYQTPFFLACEHGHLGVINLFLQSYARVVELNTMDIFMRTPLHIACLQNHLAVVGRLLACMDLNLNYVDQYENTAFGYACASGNPDIMALFIVFERGRLNWSTVINGFNKASVNNHDPIMRMLSDWVERTLPDRPEWREEINHSISYARLTNTPRVVLPAGLANLTAAFGDSDGESSSESDLEDDAQSLREEDIFSSSQSESDSESDTEGADTDIETPTSELSWPLASRPRAISPLPHMR